jgi:hypothetical protein
VGERSTRGRLVTKLALGLVGLGALGWLVARSHPAGVLAVLRGLPAAGVLVLLLFPAGIALDALAWTRLLARAGAPASFVPAYLSRLAAEAVAASLPLGGVGAEALGPSLLSRRTGLPLTLTVATSLARRWVIARAHAVYVLVGVAIAASIATRAASMRLDVALVTAFVIAVASIVAQLSAAYGRPAGATLKALVKLPFLESNLGGRAEAFSATDRTLSALATSGTWDAFTCVMGAWILEGTETYVLLRLVGIDIDYPNALALDGVLTALRSAAVVVPSGLGIQDAGFTAFLGASPESAAFLLAKRAKELVFVALGYLVLFALGGPESPRVPPRAPSSHIPIS